VRGRFITFEGPEGSGKSTQAARLAERLRGRGLEVVTVREPGGTRTGEIIRDLLQNDLAGEPLAPRSEVLLFAASRAQLVQARILPAIERGAWVVCDRFMDSTTAYQGYGRGFDVERMIAINAFAVGDASPDLTILLDLDIEASLDRMSQRNRESGKAHDRFEREARDFHTRIRNGYLELAARWPERFRIVDSDRPVDVVSEAIWSVVAQLAPSESGAAS
jgi:dTMP kinase